ncbi:MAG: hypothetical protein FD163_1972 [Hyphomonadaceae bacterium]|nr:MAG: hypothetical protein FD128_1716 [Hyphomonadaceae bacterium]KAF0184398.1 MAG: hypothetical protein FD163_1972 [Hyphomonadaceae bacterium]
MSITTKKPIENLQDFIKVLHDDIGIAVDDKKLPPVDDWSPEHCGDIGLRISADGTWWQNGVRFTRMPLVKLFSRILRKDNDGKTYLVTPYEKVIVQVDDAPFIGIRIDCHNPGPQQNLIVTTNVGETILVSQINPLRVAINPSTREPRPYVKVRGRLEALLLRAPFYELVEYGVAKGNKFGIYSNGTFFEVDSLNE